MSERSTTFDPSVLALPSTWRDPYPVFRQLQQYAPVCFSRHMGGWLLTRYDHVSSALRDVRLSSRRSAAFAERLPPEAQSSVAPLVRHLSRWTLFLDGADHARLRGLINRAFSARLVEEMRPAIEDILNGLLDAAARRGELDAMRDLAMPLPVMVIGRMLGLPDADLPALRRWSDALAPFFSGRMDEPSLRGAANAIADLDTYFTRIIEARRVQPGPDLVSALIAAEEDGRILDDEELRSTCVMLLFGGHETTTHLIGNGLYTLLRHPDERERLMRAPELIVSAVEEVLRFESPVQWQSRIALEDSSVGDDAIARGSRLFLMLGAANRDPAAFQDPDRFDIARANNRHLAFGQGAHYCVGASLGRLEGRLAIAATLARFPRVRLADPEPQWSGVSVLRGFARLPLIVT